MRSEKTSSERRIEVIKKALEILKDQLTMEEYLIFLQTITSIGEPDKYYEHLKMKKRNDKDQNSPKKS